MRPYLQRYTAELQDRALQAQSAIQFWSDCESSYKRLSQLALDQWISWRWRLMSHEIFESARHFRIEFETGRPIRILIESL